jgi:arabinofuranosyltransferase
MSIRTRLESYLQKLRQEQYGAASLKSRENIQPEYAVVIVLLALFLLVLLRTAWLSDDAYITFRTISNFAAGEGLVWNIGERVQTYTHPLWMFVVMAGVFFTHEFYFTSLAISILVSLAAAVVFVRWIAKTPMMAVFGIATMVLSRAFIDYSTSGLENALSHLILAVYLAIYFTMESSNRKLFILSLFVALVGLNRIDLLLLLLPSLGWEVWLRRHDRPLLPLLAGFTPLIAWEAFSLFYYGFPFPNTAYAKLTTGLPASELIEQGTLYMLDSLLFDPLMLLIILAGIGTALYTRRAADIAIAFGVVLYLLYIVRIGGDFMSGRFLTVPLFASISILSRIKLPNSWALAALGVIAIVGLAVPSPALMSDETYGEEYGEEGVRWRIADERAFYYQGTGLLRANRFIGLPNHEWVNEGIAAANDPSKVVVRGPVGLFGYYAGRNVHIVDDWGITDPLISRLAPMPDPYWRVGHMDRRIPDGYLSSLEKGSNLINDPNLAQYYDALKAVIRGPLLSIDRLIEIWRLNTGHYDSLLDAYTRSLPKEVSIHDLEGDIDIGDSESAIAFTEDGLRIVLDHQDHARRMRFLIDRSVDYWVIFLNAGEEVKRKLLPKGAVGGEELSEFTLGLSAKDASRGYDEIVLYPSRSDGRHIIAQLLISGN